MVFSILPTFLTEVLGASKKAFGFVEGIAIALSFVAKMMAGIGSDLMKKRKPIILLGNILTVICKVTFAFSTTVFHVFTARIMDRFVRGIRSAPTDALIADLTPREHQGASFGFRQSLYVAGSVVGGILAYIILKSSNNDFYLLFRLAVIPTLIALWIFSRFIHEGEIKAPKGKSWSISDISLLSADFWILIIATFALMLARFSTGFLNIRARELGISVHAIPLLIIAYEFAQAVIAWPIGSLADRFSKKYLLFGGILILTITNAVIVFVASEMSIILGMILAGIHMGCTQGLLSTLIAQSAPPHIRGTAFAIYYACVGSAVMFGNSFAGWVSDVFNTSVAAFVGGMFFTSISLLIICLYKGTDHYATQRGA